MSIVSPSQPYHHLLKESSSFFWAKVLTVAPDQVHCSVAPVNEAGSSPRQVRLRPASEPAGQGLFLLPEVGSFVGVVWLSDTPEESCIGLYTEVKELRFVPTPGCSFTSNSQKITATVDDKHLQLSSEKLSIQTKQGELKELSDKVFSLAKKTCPSDLTKEQKQLLGIAKKLVAALS
ncbi:hypothetical protein [Tunicatimonas pelagia]|uniref:hypothetical protein n=1 Tax=Tunicatimonas pelagia TaxID=931531 RepID=UPI0026656197|nr:hypothetical protein [Tunicatimonas pelagia]WKN42214.1 hypothetical protein P0M28_24560 [Tunicatimonas pelagia]WKN45332.1 hypothetical protein P0M28_10210 [Tunicatimonas pelagia]